MLPLQKFCIDYLHPEKTESVHGLKSWDGARNYGPVLNENCFTLNVIVKYILDVALFKDESNFHLSGYVTDHYTCFKSGIIFLVIFIIDSCLFTVLMISKSRCCMTIDCWVGISRRHIVGPTFLLSTPNGTGDIIWIISFRNWQMMKSSRHTADTGQHALHDMLRTESF